MPNIIYIHVCQKGDWKKSFTMIFNKIKESGLYDNVDEIRCGVVNDNGILIPDTLLSDPKINVIYNGYSHEYERPTLLHMKNNIRPDTNYLYCHTKGLQWFGTYNEPFILDWINLLIYWNIEKWTDAVLKLELYDTYGCNFLKKNNNDDYPDHYAGNFFWVTSNHLSKLNSVIHSQYHAPEFWLFNTPESYRYYNVYSSGLKPGGHYTIPYPQNLYKECV